MGTNKLLSKPAEQHQGEPVATVRGVTNRKSSVFDIVIHDNQALHPGTKLFLHADPGEVERLREQIKEWQETSVHWMHKCDTLRADVETMRRKNNEYWHETEGLRAQLAERDALLTKLRARLGNKHWDNFPNFDDVRDAIDSLTLAVPVAERVYDHIAQNPNKVRRTSPENVADVLDSPAALSASAEPRAPLETIEVSREDLVHLTEHAEDELEHNGTELQEVVQRVRAALERKS